MYLPDEPKEEMQRNILSRLRKIEGQVRGLQGMVSGDKECEQIPHPTAGGPIRLEIGDRPGVKELPDEVLQ